MNKCSVNQKYCSYCGNLTYEKNQPMFLTAGLLLHNRYTIGNSIGNSIGNGCPGVLYAGYDHTNHVRVSVLEYFPQSTSTRNNTVTNCVTPEIGISMAQYQSGKEKFCRAMELLEARNPNTILDSFEENNTRYFIMSFVEGENLNQITDQHGVFKLEQLLNLLRPLLESIKVMHRKGMTFLDISPNTIVMQKDGSLKYLDMGLYHMFENKEASDPPILFQSGYSPYEQKIKNGYIGSWSDVYALSATIYKCITGITPPDTQDRIKNDTLKAPSELGIRIHPGAEAAIMQGMALFRHERIQTIAELTKLLTAQTAPEQLFMTNITAKPKDKPLDTHTNTNEKRTDETIPVMIPSAPQNNHAGIILSAVLISLVIICVVLFFSISNMEREKKAPDLTPSIYSAAQNATRFSINDSCFAFIDKHQQAHIIKFTKDNNDNYCFSEEQTDETVNKNLKSFICIHDGTVLGISVDKHVSVLSDANDKIDYKKIVSSWDEVNQIVSYYNSKSSSVRLAAIKSDGSVFTETLSSSDGREVSKTDLSNWNEVMQLGFYSYTDEYIGLLNNGIIKKSNSGSLSTSIAGFSTSYDASMDSQLFIRKDGTVMFNDIYPKPSSGKSDESENGTNKWAENLTDVIALCTTPDNTIALKNDGSIVAEHGFWGLYNWNQITAIAVSKDFVIGKRTDGFVISPGSYQVTFKQETIDRFNEAVNKYY